MNTDPGDPPLLSVGPEQEWRRTFILAIYQLAAGNAGHLHVNDWAIRVHAKNGHRNPVEVAHEEWASKKA